MKRYLIVIVSFIAITAAGMLSCATAGAAAVQDEPLSFSNKDLEKYKTVSDDKTSGTKPVAEKPFDGKTVAAKTERKAEAAKPAGDRDRKEQEAWCKKGGAQQKKIDKAKEDIKAAESGTGKAARKKMETSKNRLKAAERDLADLEAEAYRKGIPAGWLRCQFE